MLPLTLRDPGAVEKRRFRTTENCKANLPTVRSYSKH